MPYIKFISFTVSYLAFIVLLIISDLQYASDEDMDEKLSVIFSQYYPYYLRYINNTNLTYRFPATDMYIRRDMPYFIDIIICIWVFGLCLRESKKLFVYGVKEYVISVNNILVSVMHLLFICSYALKYYTVVMVRIEKAKLSDPSFWNTINNMNNDEETQKYVFQTFYWLNEGKSLKISKFFILFYIKNLFSFYRSILLVCFGSDESI